MQLVRPRPGRFHAPLWVAMVATCLAPLALLPAAAAAGPRAAVLPLTRGPGVEAEPEEAARGGLRQALAGAGHEVLPPAEVERLLMVAKLRCVTEACLRDNAKVLGVDFMLGGRLSVETAGDAQSFELALWLYDRKQGATAAVHRARCAACDVARLKTWAVGVGRALLAQAADDEAPARIRIRTRPAGAAVTIDGAPVGVAPMTFGVQPGQHTVAVERSGFRAWVQEVQVKAGATELVEVFLEPSAGSARDGGGSRPAAILKWVALGAGVAALAAGIALIAMDGEETCDAGWGPAACPERQATLAPGIALTVTGGLAAGVAGLLFYYDARPKEPTDGQGTRSATALVPAALPGGGGLFAVTRF